ncbi:hypothetical protein QQP08_016139 [Theobroma cacao]|nr:hypothetical protein QQP08_016139 [Theobroma cacao]
MILIMVDVEFKHVIENIRGFFHVELKNLVPCRVYVPRNCARPLPLPVVVDHNQQLRRSRFDELSSIKKEEGMGYRSFFQR